MEKTTERESLCSVLVIKYYSNEQIENNEMSRARSIHGGEKRCIEGFGLET